MKNLLKIYDLNLEEMDEVIILKIINYEDKKRARNNSFICILGITGFPTSEQKEVLRTNN